MSTKNKKYALITGASRGIGKAITKELAAQGYDLYLTCEKNTALLQSDADTLSSEYGIHCVCFGGDLGNSSYVDEIFQQITSLDVLINCAGIAHIGLLQDMTDEEWHHVMRTNVDSVFYTCRKAIPLMLAQGNGCIINISSVWGITGASMETAYSASKGAVNALTKALGKELAPSHIRVNAIACGLIDTEMNNHLSSEELQEIISEIPADRIGKPEEVASLVLHLIHAPEYLTGQIITMDGGWI
ncbi:MAG: SDR family oxidoreductase [Lachnospiraceae bacterium]|nr:SDR family oxidoreductase [Lachnospiraceae bacterium]